jgi:hypothetical protein
LKKSLVLWGAPLVIDAVGTVTPACVVVVYTMVLLLGLRREDNLRLVLGVLVLALGGRDSRARIGVIVDEQVMATNLCVPTSWDSRCRVL